MKSSIDEIVRARAAALLRGRIERGEPTPAWVLAVAEGRPLAHVVLRPFSDVCEKHPAVAEAAMFCAGLKAEAIGFAADVFVGSRTQMAPSEDPAASEAMAIVIVTWDEARLYLWPYGRDDGGRVVWRDPQGPTEAGGELVALLRRGLRGKGELPADLRPKELVRWLLARGHGVGLEVSLDGIRCREAESGGWPSHGEWDDPPG